MNLIVHVGHVHYHGGTVLIELLLDGERTEILCLVVGNLVALHAQGLCEIAVAIQETYSTHVYVAVAGFLQVVASQDAQTTGVDLQHLVQTVLHAQVGHAGTCSIGLHVHVGAEVGIYIIHLRDDGLVLGQFLHFLKAQILKKQYGVATTFLEEFLIEVAEQTACVVVPCPPHVVGQFSKLAQLGGHIASYGNGLPAGLVHVACLNLHNT